MKRIHWLGPLVALGLVAVGLVACRAGSLAGNATIPVARWRFLGATQLQSQSKVPALVAAFSGTNAGAVGARLATNLTRVLLQRLDRPDADGALKTLAPLMLDVLRNESAGEISTTGWRLTVKLPSERWPAWQQSGNALLSLRGPATGGVLSYTNGWLTTGSGAVAGKGWMTLSNDVAFAGEGDLARIFNRSSTEWPSVKISAGLGEGSVTTQATLDFSEPPLGPLPAWKLPEKMAHAPFSQFTAVRGVSRVAGRLDWWREVFAGQPPDQIFCWAQPEVEFRNWLAVPTADPVGDLRRLFAVASKQFGVPGGRSGRMVMATNQLAFAILDTFKGLQPVVSQVKQQKDTFLLASMYPASASTNLISANLRRLLAEPGLVFEDAESTPDAIDHWNVLFQLNHMLQSHLPNARHAKGHAWMFELRGALAESESVGRQVSPTRFHFQRRSSIGLTGLEMVLLSRWLDGDDYLLRHVGPPPLPKP